MTAILVDEGVDTTIEDEVVLTPPPPMCEAEYTDGTTCENSADYICAVSCCRVRVLLCEDCFFEFIDYCEQKRGTVFECQFCDETVVLHPNHLIVTGKI